MDLRLATLKAVSFYLLHNVSTMNQCRKLSCDTFVCKHFASYQGYRNYRWDLIWYAKGQSNNLCVVKIRKVVKYVVLNIRHPLFEGFEVLLFE
jgi:hypothetical protein